MALITSLSPATATSLGGVIDGTGLTIIADGTISVDYGTSSGTSVQGNDTRVTADQAVGTASIRTLGTGSLQAAAGNHTHLYAASSSAGGAATTVSSPDGDRNASTKLPTTSGKQVRFDFASASTAGTGGNYAGVMTYAPWDGTTSSTGDASYQLAFGSEATNATGLPKLNIRNGIDSTWNSWYTLLHSGYKVSSGSTTIGVLGYNGTTAAAGQLDGGSTAPSGTTRLNYGGYFYATRVYNAVYNDYAEYFEKGETNLEPGDVVALGEDGKYIKSQVYCDNKVVGVYSDSFGHILGGTGAEDDEENFIPIGLAGRVSVKVVGDIKKGDLLVASAIPGIATSGKEQGCIIGKALEDHEGFSIDKIKMLILNA